MLSKVLITTGGTAGHIFPAVAVIQEVKKKYPDIEILFVGSTAGQESAILKEYDIPFIPLPVKGFMGKGIKSIAAFFLLIKSIIKALSICKKFTPDAIIGFGGYACFPSVIAGRILGIPCLLHEQNIISGVANKLLSKIVQTVCISFPEARSQFTTKHIVLTGNPARSSYCASETKLSSTPQKRMLVLGGSLGAIRINSYIVDIAPALLDMGIEIWHQTGKRDFEAVEDSYKELGVLKRIRVSSFIKDMKEAYSWADFAVCRAGAGTIIELSCMAIPAIFIPFPAAVHNHQWHNAQSLVRANASMCFTESMLTNTILLDAISTMSKPENILEMRQKMHQQARYNCAELIIVEIEHCVMESKK